MTRNIVEIDAQYETNPNIRVDTDAAAESRKKFINAVASLAPRLPELPDLQALSTYERLVELERNVAPTGSVDEYADGTASEVDDILVQRGDGAPLLSADHATNPIRKSTGKMGGADHGTAALALSLGDEFDASVVLPRGMQTGNGNVDVEHPLKREIAKLLPDHDSFVSIHGMVPGKFVHQHDPTEVHAVLGLGTNPTARMLDIAADIQRHMKESYGLKIVIGDKEHFFDDPKADGRLRYREDGNPIYAPRLAAMGEGSTTNFVRANTADDYAALQIEISRSLRLLPHEKEYRDEQRKIMAVYLGYLMTRDVVGFVTPGLRS